MANMLSLGIDRAGAIRKLDRWLLSTCGAERLNTFDKEFTDAWCVTVQAAGENLGLEIRIPSGYPRLLPNIFLRNPPHFGTWPHVETTGRLCIAAPFDRYDRDRPVEVLSALIEGAIDIVEKGISSSNQDDFRREFLSYWNLQSSGIAWRSIIDPSGPTRKIKVWPGKKGNLLADSSTAIRAWLANLGTKNAVADAMINDGAYLWLPRALLPSEYPRTVQDLYAIAAIAEGEAVSLLDRLLKACREPKFTVVLAAPAGDGVCFGGLELDFPKIQRGPSVKRQMAASQVADIRLNQWKSASLIRTQVNRVDAFWIHGRDNNKDLMDLRQAKVVLVGCGSLGSHTARFLALAGVAELVLIDPEILEWANIGRHVLGASAQGQSKASALACQLRREFPHSTFTDLTGTWQEHAAALQSCDVIVSTTGSLDDEAELTHWQRSHPGTAFVFGWTEPSGCASQAVAIMPGNGCLLCGFDQQGQPEFQATSWDELPLKREAACGNWFMPYGADQIASAAILTADLAIDLLTGRAAAGTHRVSSTRGAILAAAGGAWSENWFNATREGGQQNRTVERSWLANMQCPICHGGGPA